MVRCPKCDVSPRRYWVQMDEENHKSISHYKCVNPHCSEYESEVAVIERDEDDE